MLLLSSNPHQRAFICGAYTGTTEVGVSEENKFSEPLAPNEWIHLLIDENCAKHGIKKTTKSALFLGGTNRKFLETWH